MWKHLLIVSVAVISAVSAAGGVVALDRVYQAHIAASAARAAPTAPADGAVAKGPDGHFWAEANVNGRPVRFLVDTGATTVALTAADARKLGLDTSRLNYARSVATASGDARAAQVELDYVSVAGARVNRVTALVLDKGLETSLLGMSYLGRLSSFEATRHSLVLHP